MTDQSALEESDNHGNNIVPKVRIFVQEIILVACNREVITPDKMGYPGLPWSCWTQIYPAFANSVDPDQLASSEAN